MRVSPDGKHVYASSEIDDTVAVFTRNSTTGGLTFVEFHKDGVGGVDGLDELRELTVSPDGSHVYAAGLGDNALAVFSRDSTTGALTFTTTSKDGVGGVDGLNGVISVMVSPDGQHLYTAAGVASAVAVFSRNSGTGALSFVEVHQDGVSGVDGLSLATGISVIPDGKHVYGTGRSDNAVAVFSGQPAANLSIAKSANPSPVAAGFNLTPNLPKG